MSKEKIVIDFKGIIQRILSVRNRTVSDMSGRGQPACWSVWKKCKKELDSSEYVMYIFQLYMKCSTPVLFTCIAVLSRVVVKGGCTSEIWIIEVYNKVLGGPTKQGRYNMGGSWQEAQSNPRMRPRWAYLQGASRNSSSSMYKVHIVVVTRTKKKRLGCYKLPIWFIDYADTLLSAACIAHCASLTIYFL